MDETVYEGILYSVLGQTDHSRNNGLTIPFFPVCRVIVTGDGDGRPWTSRGTGVSDLGERRE